MKILAEASVPYLKGVIEDMGEVTYLPSNQFTPETVADKEWLIVRSITKCTPSLLQNSKVKLITTATIGFDHIDTEYCHNNGIVWHNAPGCNAEAVGQWFGSVMAILQITNNITLHGTTLGIVGVGHVGSVIQRYAKALGCNVLLCDPPRAEAEGNQGFVSMQEIAQQCDIITFHTPLTKTGPHATWHLLDHNWVHTLKRKPLIINACRGAVTCNQALTEGLQKGFIGNIVLDCWEGEPNPSPTLLQQVRLGTPHIAGFSADGKANGARVCVGNGAEFFGIPAPRIQEMYPPAPQNPTINLAQYSNNRVAHALLHTLDLRSVHNRLLTSNEEFEHQRRTYLYPREPKAFTVQGATSAEGEVLAQIGFQVV